MAKLTTHVPASIAPLETEEVTVLPEFFVGNAYINDEQAREKTCALMYSDHLVVSRKHTLRLTTRNSFSRFTYMIPTMSNDCGESQLLFLIWPTLA